jgi:phosphoglucosamine mutase
VFGHVISGYDIVEKMSNGGAGAYLKKQGIEFMRAKVGDRHVLEMLKKNGGMLGGEASGHIIVLDKTTTGDGIIAAIQVLSAVRASGRALKELADEITLLPSIQKKVRVEKRFDPMEVPALSAEVARIEGALGEGGRIVLRASGTEPVIRILVEARDKSVAESAANELASAVSAASI